MQKGIDTGLFMSLPKCETNDFLKTDQIKDRDFSYTGIEAGNETQKQKLNYAKQKALLHGLDAKLNYFSLQKERHPYIKELRDFANAQKNELKTVQNSWKQHEDALNKVAEDELNKTGKVSKDHDLSMKEIIKLRYRTTQKDDQFHA